MKNALDYIRLFILLIICIQLAVLTQFYLKANDMENCSVNYRNGVVCKGSDD